MDTICLEAILNNAIGTKHVAELSHAFGVKICC